MKKVLVVDDREDNRLLVEEVVENAGHTAVGVDNGCGAWRLLSRGDEKFDLIISDKDMPVMTGVELLRLVRTDSRTVSIPFILMSGDRVVSEDDQTPLEDVCATLGATFLGKPFSVFHLLALLGVEMGGVGVEKTSDA